MSNPEDRFLQHLVELADMATETGHLHMQAMYSFHDLSRHRFFKAETALRQAKAAFLELYRDCPMSFTKLGQLLHVAEQIGYTHGELKYAKGHKTEVKRLEREIDHLRAQQDDLLELLFNSVDSCIMTPSIRRPYLHRIKNPGRRRK
jgi:hypothetical protein